MIILAILIIAGLLIYDYAKLIEKEEKQNASDSYYRNFVNF